MTIVVCCPASFFSDSSVLSCPPLQGGFCNGVVSSNVAKPGEVASFDCCQQHMVEDIGPHIIGITES